MHKRPIAIVLALVLFSAAGCSKFTARVELNKGNALYAEEEYQEALTHYERGLELDPKATFAWRSVGLSALALYRPGDESPANKEFGKKAIQAFENYLSDPEFAADEKVRDYLLTTYVNAEEYDRALAYIDEEEKAKGANPKYTKTKINILSKAEQYDKVSDLAMNYKGEDQAEVLYTLGVTAWDESYNDPKWALADREKIVDKGLAAVDKALQIKPDYFEAMAYYNLLYREKAKMAIDPAKQQEFVAKADEWKNKAIELQKKLKAAQPPAPAGGDTSAPQTAPAAPAEG